MLAAIKFCRPPSIDILYLRKIRHDHEPHRIRQPKHHLTNPLPLILRLAHHLHRDLVEPFRQRLGLFLVFAYIDRIAKQGELFALSVGNAWEGFGSEGVAEVFEGGVGEDEEGGDEVFVIG